MSFFKQSKAMSKNKTQKILIPKGTVDPNEDTLIEIPATIEKLPIVVAKKPESEQNIVSLERYSKNFEARGSKYSMPEGRSSIRIKENDKTYSPRHHGSLRNLQENRTQNDSIIMKNSLMENKLEAMQKAQKELDETAFMTAMNFLAFEKNQSLTEPKSTSSYQHSSVHAQKPIGSTASRLNQDFSAIGTNETLERYKRTSSTCTSVSSKKSQQSMTLKPQDSKGAPIDSTSLNKDAPFCSTSKRSDANVSFLFVPQNTAEKKNKEVLQMKDKAQSAAYLSDLFFKKPCQTSSHKRLKEDKEMNSDSSAIEEKESRHYHVSRKKRKSKCSCNDNESSSTGEDDSGDSKEIIKQMYKYSENVTCIDAASNCDSVPERDAPFIPSSSSSKHRCRGVSVSDLTENPSRTLNGKENSWQKVESGRSEISKNYEIYENKKQETKRHDDSQVPESKFQQDIDLKIPNPDIPSPRLTKVSKDGDTQTERISSIDTNSSNDLKITTKEGKAEEEKKRTELCNHKPLNACCKAKSTNSIKFVTEPRDNFSDSDSISEKNSSTSSRKMNN